MVGSFLWCFLNLCNLSFLHLIDANCKLEGQHDDGGKNSGPDNCEKNANNLSAQLISVEVKTTSRMAVMDVRVGEEARPEGTNHAANRVNTKRIRVVRN